MFKIKASAAIAAVLALLSRRIRREYSAKDWEIMCLTFEELAAKFVKDCRGEEVIIPQRN